MFQTNRAELWTTIASFPTEEYSFAGRGDVIHAIANRLRQGVPGEEAVQLPSGEVTAATDPDVVNAAWLARVEDASTPIDALSRKAIESLDLMRRWADKGVLVPVDLYVRDSTQAGNEVGATLSENLITSRLQALGPERLIVAPLMHRPKGAALDLRLGNRFIVFHRTSTASFDPLSRDDDPRAIQVYVELSWSEQFILHPQELVLGATLEYLVMPQDLTGQVVTRSSYGRLGLPSATAVQIHPNFHGCLTLELVNLSTIPLALTPGERIAQLVLSHTSPTPPSEGEKYTYSIGPEFSRVRDDAEADVLRAILSP
jgi:deoxycytidine triphosphate deaminase